MPSSHSTVVDEANTGQRIPLSISLVLILSSLAQNQWYCFLSLVVWLNLPFYGKSRDLLSTHSRGWVRDYVWHCMDELNWERLSYDYCWCAVEERCSYRTMFVCVCVWCFTDRWLVLDQTPGLCLLNDRWWSHFRAHLEGGREERHRFPIKALPLS